MFRLRDGGLRDRGVWKGRQLRGGGCWTRINCGMREMDCRWGLALSL